MIKLLIMSFTKKKKSCPLNILYPCFLYLFYHFQRGTRKNFQAQLLIYLLLCAVLSGCWFTFQVYFTQYIHVHDCYITFLITVPFMIQHPGLYDISELHFILSDMKIAILTYFCFIVVQLCLFPRYFHTFSVHVISCHLKLT